MAQLATKKKKLSVSITGLPDRLRGDKLLMGMEELTDFKGRIKALMNNN